MPLLAADEALPARPRRVLIAGTSGSGKTTLATRIAVVTGAPHIEIDALFHGPDWTPLPSFEADVEEFSARPRWVTEWQYPPVRELLAARADTLIWLDLPRATVMRHVTDRTLRRRLARQRLWNNNIEQPLWTILTNRDHIIRWAWDTHHLTAVRVQSLCESQPELTIVRLRSHAEAQGWLEGPLANSSPTALSD